METTLPVPGGHRIPRLGFGTYQIAPRDTERLVGEALRAAQEDGRLSQIGVSNFHRAQLDRILADGGPPPVVNQIEAHPHFANNDLRRYCAERGISVAAWPRLGAGSVLRDPAIQSLARVLGRTPAQIIIRWHLQRGDMVLPKASSPQRIAENAAVFDFSLDTGRMAAVDRLDRGAAGRTGPHPECL